MPYSDHEKRRLLNRQYNRKVRHGPFRQIFVDNNGMCQGILSSGHICGSVDALEYHEIFKENKPGNGHDQFSLRTLLCFPCHAALNLGDHHFSHRKYCSRLAEDMSIELVRAGGYKKWLAKYKLVDRYQPQTVLVKEREDE